MKVSELYRMDIYSDAGQYLGEVQDVILNLEKGEIGRLLMVPMGSAKGDVKSLLKQKSILYKSVNNVGDVVLVSSPSPAGAGETPKEEADELSR